MQQPSRRKGEPHILCTIRFCFGNARVLVHSLWYADKLNSMAVRAPRRRPTQLCTDDELTSVSCRVRKKMSTLLGGPCHSGAPRLCLPCLPCRDATGCDGTSILTLRESCNVNRFCCFTLALRIHACCLQFILGARIQVTYLERMFIPPNLYTRL